jgi:hypothetical protein
MASMKPTFAGWLRCLPILGLVSCAAPQPEAVAEAEPPKPVEVQTTAVVEPAVTPPDDGIRLPDMLGLPGDSEFRTSASPPTPLSPGGGAVVARPPTDPPSRPKVEDDEPGDAGE